MDAHGGQPRHKARLLLTPGYVPLRNPYLLTRYLELHGDRLVSQSTAPGPIDIDWLLEEVVRVRLDRVAAILQTDVVTLTTAFTRLVDRLWESRSDGIGHPDAVHLLDETLPGEGKQALVAFRRTGLLAADAPIRILDGPIADHFFAAGVADRLRENMAELSKLDPEKDGTVVEALIGGVPGVPSW